MSFAALLPIAAELGLPLVRQVLSRKIGQRNSELAEAIVSAIAERAGVSVEVLPDFARDEPAVVATAMQEVERAAPEMIALHETALEKQMQLQLAEMDKGHWITWVWRPVWMYFLALMWGWHTIGLHVVNAIYKTAIPAMDLTTLLGLTSLFLGLYMGGHTLKEVFGKVRNV